MSARSKSNPFSQPKQLWTYSFELPLKIIAQAEQSFDDLALSVSSYEIDEDAGVWGVQILCDNPQQQAEITQRLHLLTGMVGCATPSITMQELIQEDWLARVAQDFPPLHIPPFYVHGQHITAPSQPHLKAIQVDAGAAFGSGEHGTTRGCLEAMAWLAKKRSPQRVLDMGCGSGILAIAAAKLWNAQVMASDIDEVAVRVTQKNIRVNRVDAAVTALVSDGYQHPAIGKTGPYEVIIANILAAPLVAFAPALAAHLTPGGFAILSGLLRWQETLVLSAHRMQGLRLVKRYRNGDWSALVLEK